MNQDPHGSLNQAQKSCPSTQVSRFLDGDLVDHELVQFEDHLEVCSDCRQQLEMQTAAANVWSEACLSLRDQNEELDHSDHSQQSSQYISRMVLDSLSPTDDPAMLGRLGPYEISGVIGQGGMGVVLKAYDGALSRFVALKVLRPHLSISGAARQRFFREAKAAATINHDNVMPIHAVAEHNDVPYLVMPYVRGESLQKRIQEKGPLPSIEVVRIGMQIASGLSAAHAQGLVHRDIKPANIILEDGIEKLWITDFGLARMVDDASLTRTGVIAGTPEYMSPEQSRGESVDERSDLFSLGAVMYAMCTGHSPFRAKSSYGVLRRITDDEPRSIREINEQIPTWLEKLIFKLLAKKPAERFESSLETAALLEESLAHLQHPAAFELPKPIEALAPSKKTESWRTIAWMAAALMILIAGTWFAFQVTPDWMASSSREPAKTSASNDTKGIGLNQKPAPIISAPQEAGQDKTAAIELSRSEQVLPHNTPVWISIPDVKRFRENFDATQFGELFADDAMKAFVAQFELDFQNLIEDENLPFVFDLLQEDWISGEACFAFTDATAGKGFEKERITPVFFVDVTGSEKQANESISQRLAKLTNANQKVIDHYDARKLTRTTFGPEKSRRTILHKVAKGWLVVCEDEQLINEIVVHLGHGRGMTSLSENPSFLKCMERSNFDKAIPNLNWFVKPIDAMKLIQRLEQKGKGKPKKDDWVGVLEAQGFDVFSGIGGRMAFSTPDHELVHRCFVCQTFGRNIADQKNVLGLFDFRNYAAVAPPRWIPATASSCLIADWNKSRAMESFGPIYDAFLGEPGSYARLLHDFKMDPDLQFDVPKFLFSLDHRTILMSHITNNGSAKMEQPVLGLKIREDSGYVMDTLKRVVGANTKIQIVGFEGFESMLNTEANEIDAKIFELADDKAVANGFEPVKRFFVTANGFLLVSNNKERIKRLLEKGKHGTLVEADDYIQIHAALGKLTQTKKVAIRKFGRLDLSLKANYELFRAGELHWTRLIDPLTVIRESEQKAEADRKKEEAEPRKPRFNGSSLPENFDKVVAPYLGLFGWVLENEPDGWTITGCVLKK